MGSRMRWGDALEDEDVLPPPSVSGPDGRGIKTIIEYKKNDKGDTVKVTTRIKMSKVEKKIYSSVQERRHLAKFGEAVTDTPTDSVTVQAVEEIPLERAQGKQTQEEKKAQDFQDAMKQSDKSVIVGSLRDMLQKRRMERQLMQARGLLNPEKPPEDDGGAGPSLGAPKSGGYVAPHLRGGAVRGTGETDGGRQRRDENSVRVTNLSEDTREEDLRELFSRFGPISRIYIAYDKETGENRGFAFVNFVYREDALRAIEKLDGYGYDNLILRVEWAQPRAER